MTNQNSTETYLKTNTEPSAIDVLCGRGKIYSKHPGNQKFNDVIRENLHRYSSAPSRIDKSIVVASVVEPLLASGIKFLKWDKNNHGFRVLNREEVHDKVGHAIRDLRKTKGRRSSSASSIASLRSQETKIDQSSQGSAPLAADTAVIPTTKETRVATHEETDDLSPNVPASRTDLDSPLTNSFVTAMTELETILGDDVDKKEDNKQQCSQTCSMQQSDDDESMDEYENVCFSPLRLSAQTITTINQEDFLRLQESLSDCSFD